MDFPGGLTSEGSGVVTAVVQIWSLTLEFQHVIGLSKKKNLKKNKLQLFDRKYEDKIPGLMIKMYVQDMEYENQGSYVHSVK